MPYNGQIGRVKQLLKHRAGTQRKGKEQDALQHRALCQIHFILSYTHLTDPPFLPCRKVPQKTKPRGTTTIIPRGHSPVKPECPESVMEMQLAGRTSLCDGVRQIQLQAGRLRDAAVAVHGDVAEFRAGLIIDPQLLPCRKQRAVMELDL